MLKPKPGILPFSVAITALTIVGHAYLGFEQAWVQPLVAVLTAYTSEIVIELCIVGWGAARFRGSFRRLVVFLLPAHITGLAVGMLLYANERTSVFAFAAAVAIFSKVLFRVPSPSAGGNGTVHFLNPSNFGITISLLAFWDLVGAAPPYQFSEQTYGWADWVLPVIIVCAGTALNTFATKRIFVALGWCGGFVLQALGRSILTDQSTLSLLVPMTGPAFILFTFYMVTDPATTPQRRAHQLTFGASAACTYGALTVLGIPFGMFFALTAVCIARGTVVWLLARRRPQLVVAN